jgi:hypothetical protein
METANDDTLQRACLYSCSNVQLTTRRPAHCSVVWSEYVPFAPPAGWQHVLIIPGTIFIMRPLHPYNLPCCCSFILMLGTAADLMAYVIKIVLYLATDVMHAT